MLAAVAGGLLWIRRFDLFSIKSGEAVYRDASLGADRSAPREAVIVAMQMSGALKYYTDRTIARWESVTPDRFERLRNAVRERNLRLYALLRQFEEKSFAASLPGRWTRVGAWRDVGLWRND